MFLKNRVVHTGEKLQKINLILYSYQYNYFQISNNI